jgi:hypothetical protein
VDLLKGKILVYASTGCLIGLAQILNCVKMLSSNGSADGEKINFKENKMSSMNDWDNCTEKKTGKCDECRRIRVVAWIVDPYMEQVYNEPVEKWICSGCYAHILGDME